MLYKPYMDLSINEDLVSGLLTALNQFTIMEFKEQGIESIDMGGLRWVYVLDKEKNLLFIAAANKDDKAVMLRARLNVIRQSFIKEYIDDNNEWRENWNGNIEMFIPFKDVLDEYYSNWLAAEHITTMAEFFDILGVFQQLFFDILAVVHNHVQEEPKERIYLKIEKMFENYINDEYVKKNPELNKITFSREAGINIITINPNNCNYIVVETQLINLIKSVMEIIKSEITHLKTLEFFAKEKFFDYILNNINLLNQLHLDKFLLQLFLTE